MLLETFSPMVQRVMMQRSKVCLGCRLNIADINTKDRRVLVKATDLVPLWEEILQIKLYELDPDAALSKSTLLSILGSAEDPNHGMAWCVKSVSIPIQGITKIVSLYLRT